jgi:uncharacterized protein YerC
MTDATSSLSSLERAYLDDLARIEREISALQRERLSVQRLVLRARRENVENVGVTRKNSLDRILIERAILEAISSSQRPVSLAQIDRVARAIKHDLKPVTLRSYLSRMKERALVSPASRGFWTLPQRTARK